MNSDTAMRHWAYDLVGAPYEKKAAGPTKFDCLGLMEYVFLKHKGLVLPVTGIRLGESTNMGVIRDAAKSAGLRPVFDMPQEDDLVLMDSPEGPHVGLAVVTNYKLHLLHSMDPVGVCLSRMSDLSFLGYKNIKSWRLASD